MTHLSTGIEGLDEILKGGLLAGRTYLVRGKPGAGKTTLAMQFLLEGARLGESVLFVTLSESETELRSNSELHEWDLSGVRFLDIHPDEGDGAETQYSIFHPADVELVPALKRIIEALDQFKPSRVVFDSLTEVRLLSRDPLRYRHQILALKNTLQARGITTLFIGERSEQELDLEIASATQGIISLWRKKGHEGLVRRTVEVEKYRGSTYREGEHPLRIVQGGLRVFPRLIANEHEIPFTRGVMPSGVEKLDAMLAGGLDRGTCTLITGQAGVGKTTVGAAFLVSAARRGEPCAFYTFDEGPAEILYRCDSIGIPLRQFVDDGLIRIRKINPLVLYPDEFASWIRDEVENRDTKAIIIDSLNGYNESMPDEKYLNGHMHQLTSYLNRMGVVTVLLNEVSNLIGPFSASQFGLSYMTDSIIVLRYYELEGVIYKAIGALKKRLSNHEKSLRSFEMTSGGIVVGNTLPNLRGILRGEASRSLPNLQLGDDVDE